MMISQTAEYALRAIVCLAGHGSTALGAIAIAQLTRVPAGYLSKVLQQLSRAGLVTSIKGRKGGFVLARSAAALSALEVVQAVDGAIRVARCPLGLKSHSGVLCLLHRRLDESFALAERALAETMIAGLVGEAAAGPPWCDDTSASSPAL